MIPKTKLHNVKKIYFFNENFKNETIKETVSHILDNKLKLTFNKTALSADGYYNYDDWLKILLAQVCVYKLS